MIYWGEGFTINCYKPKYNLLEGMAAYGRLLLAPAEGWWPLATWRGPSGPL